MIINPIYKKDLNISNKSIRFAALVSLFNFILAIFCINNLDSQLSIARMYANISYNAFLDLFMLLIFIDCIFILFIMPLFTAVSISSERESQSLYLILSTKITAKDVVLGKLYFALHSMTLFIISAVPVKVVTLMYTALSMEKILLIMLTYFVVLIYIASIGIYISSLSRKSSNALALAYSVIIASILLTVSGFENFFMISPLSTFLAIINNLSLYNYEMNSFSVYIVQHKEILSMDNFYMIAVAQLCITFTLLAFSIYNIDPRFNKISFFIE